MSDYSSPQDIPKTVKGLTRGKALELGLREHRGRLVEL